MVAGLHAASGNSKAKKQRDGFMSYDQSDAVKTERFKGHYKAAPKTTDVL